MVNYTSIIENQIRQAAMKTKSTKLDTHHLDIFSRRALAGIIREAADKWAGSKDGGAAIIANLDAGKSVPSAFRKAVHPLIEASFYITTAYLDRMADELEKRKARERQRPISKVNRKMA